MSWDFTPVCPKCSSLNVAVADMFMLQCKDCRHYGRYQFFDPRRQQPKVDNDFGFDED